MNCSCEKCQAACRHEPGAFEPTQTITVPVEIRYRDVGGRRLFLPTPRMANGACEHFVEGRCAIYADRPAECASFQHDDTQRRIDRRLDRIALKWSTNTAQLLALR